jgi:hypothetical protein
MKNRFFPFILELSYGRHHEFVDHQYIAMSQLLTGNCCKYEFEPSDS